MATAFDTPVLPFADPSPISQPVDRGLDPRDQRVGRALHPVLQPRPRRPAPSSRPTAASARQAAHAAATPRRPSRPRRPPATGPPARAARATRRTRRAARRHATRRAAATTRRAAAQPRRRRRAAGRRPPIAGYDDLTAEEIVAKLPEQSQTTLVAGRRLRAGPRQAHDRPPARRRAHRPRAGAGLRRAERRRGAEAPDRRQRRRWPPRCATTSAATRTARASSRPPRATPTPS